MYALAIHGGAGTLAREWMTSEKESAYRQGLGTALDIGNLILKNGGSSLDAVEACVKQLENNPLFNAGLGAVFTHEGKHELDASIMDGKTRKAGAIAGVRRIANPIQLARAVMDKSEHVMLCGEGAEDFALFNGFDLVENSFFYTDFRFHQLQEALKSGGTYLDHSLPDVNNTKPIGTVGAVALDMEGNLAAATSTGGMTNKRWGRVGDTPIIGAGTYADNRSCAISCTGHGEFFIRAVVAYNLHARMIFGNQSLNNACQELVLKELVQMGAEGGLIAIDFEGNICLPFNSDGMYRASIKEGENPHIQIYNND
jgi:beta-aspartyl-peptidase (threonine type)